MRIHRKLAEGQTQTGLHRPGVGVGQGEILKGLEERVLRPLRKIPAMVQDTDLNAIPLLTCRDQQFGSRRSILHGVEQQVGENPLQHCGIRMDWTLQVRRKIKPRPQGGEL
jgi:hypothetical protein